MNIEEQLESFLNPSSKDLLTVEEILEHYYTKTFRGRWEREHYEHLEKIREDQSFSSHLNTFKASLFCTFPGFIKRVELVPIYSMRTNFKFFGEANTVSILTKSFENQDEFQKLLERHGYMISKFEQRRDGDFYQFKSKFPIDISKEDLKEFKLFYISSAEQSEQILKNGLVPKKTKNIFKNPFTNRIYLFACADPQNNLKAVLNSFLKENEVDLKDIKIFQVEEECVRKEELYLDNFYSFEKNKYAMIFSLYDIKPTYLKPYKTF